jgi:hypothetical protein
MRSATERHLRWPAPYSALALVARQTMGARLRAACEQELKSSSSCLSAVVLAQSSSKSSAGEWRMGGGRAGSPKCSLDASDRIGRGEEGDHLAPCVTVIADEDIDGIGTAEQLGPLQALVARRGRL